MGIDASLCLYYCSVSTGGPNPRVRHTSQPGSGVRDSKTVAVASNESKCAFVYLCLFEK